MSNFKFWILNFIGFIIGFTITLAGEGSVFLLLDQLNRFMFNSTIHPIGLGWILMPFAGGLAFAATLPTLYMKLANNIKLASSLTRFMLVIPFFWVFIVLLFALLFDPHSLNIYSRDFTLVLKIIFFPICVLWVGFFMYRKLIRNNRQRDN